MTGFTRKRVAALALVGVALLTLAWVGMRGDDPVSVPKGALAGDLLLHPCTYDTEGGGYAADCGTLVVPENRHDSASRLIAIPVTRIRALSPSPKEPVFRLQGGAWEPVQTIEGIDGREIAMSGSSAAIFNSTWDGGPRMYVEKGAQWQETLALRATDGAPPFRPTRSAGFWMLAFLREIRLNGA